MHYQNLAVSVAKLPDEWVSFCVGVSANLGCRFGLATSGHQQGPEPEAYKQIGGCACMVGNFVAVKPTPTTVFLPREHIEEIVCAQQFRKFCRIRVFVCNGDSSVDNLPHKTGRVQTKNKNSNCPLPDANNIAKKMWVSPLPNCAFRFIFNGKLFSVRLYVRVRVCACLRVLCCSWNIGFPKVQYCRNR